MKATPRDARAHADKQHDEPGRNGGDGLDRGHDGAAARESFDDQRRRVGAAQVAAPSTRRWRRAGRFSSQR